MNYEDVSDFEINAAVTNLIYDCNGWELNWTNNCFFHCEIDGSGYYKQTIHNYCNNPSYAWNIIIENGISINKYWKDDKKWTADVEHPNACDEYNTIEVEHENPLRAACICFLLMKDAENEPSNSNTTSR